MEDTEQTKEKLKTDRKLTKRLKCKIFIFNNYIINIIYILYYNIYIILIYIVGRERRRRKIKFATDTTVTTDWVFRN